MIADTLKQLGALVERVDAEGGDEVWLRIYGCRLLPFLSIEPSSRSQANVNRPAKSWA